MSIFVSAGEVSGDHYIARVSRDLRRMGYDGRIRGLCGAESRASGVEGLWNAERLQLIGVSEVVGSIGDIIRLKSEMCREIIASRPSALVVADSPDFHLPLIRSLRRAGYDGRIFYISPPSVWAWRGYRVRDLKKHVDENLPLFKFEHDYLEQAGCETYWTGHPLVEEFGGWKPDRAEVASRISGGDVSADDKIIALLPGSRRSEIEMLYPILSGLCATLEERGYRPVFSVAPGLSEHASDMLRSNLTAESRFYFEGPGRELMAVSEAVVGSSGTATAQALLLRKFMIILYRLKPFTAFIGKIFLRHLHFGIPNLLAGETFYPELIQEGATVENTRNAIFGWLDADGEEKSRVEARMSELAALMGKPGVCEFWADRILMAVDREQ